MRAKVEHVFRVIKCQFSYRKVRYRGLAKNDAGVQTDGACEPLTRERVPEGGLCLKSPKWGKTAAKVV